MTSRLIPLFSVMLLAAGLAACSQSTPKPAPAPEPKEVTALPAGEAPAVEDAEEMDAPEEPAHDESAGDDHVHDDHDHDDHDHVHVAPRGGTLIELGDHMANIELLLDAEQGKFTMYALDAHAENPVRMTAMEVPIEVDFGDGSGAVQMTLLPRENPLTGEVAGDTSEFFVVHDLFKEATRFQVHIPVLDMRGMTFVQVRFAFSGDEG